MVWLVVLVFVCLRFTCLRVAHQEYAETKKPKDNTAPKPSGEMDPTANIKMNERVVAHFSMDPWWNAWKASCFGENMGVRACSLGVLGWGWKQHRSGVWECLIRLNGAVEVHNLLLSAPPQAPYVDGMEAWWWDDDVKSNYDFKVSTGHLDLCDHRALFWSPSAFISFALALHAVIVQHLHVVLQTCRAVYVCTRCFG